MIAAVAALPLLASAAHAEGTVPAAAAAATDVAQDVSALPAPVKVPRAATQAPAGPLNDQQRALVAKISASLTSVRTLIGDFVQIGPDGTRSEGKFYLPKPGRVRFEYDPPNPLELISDGESVAIRDRKLATQDLLLLSQTPLRFLLAEKLDLLKEGNLVNVYSDDVFATIVIDEKQTLGGTHRLTLMFNPQTLQLRQWTVTDPQGFDTTVALYNLDASKKPDPGLFHINYERLRN
jgi:outer membrane lipoprotein-sorting protein